MADRLRSKGAIRLTDAETPEHHLRVALHIDGISGLTVGCIRPCNQHGVAHQMAVGRQADVCRHWLHLSVAPPGSHEPGIPDQVATNSVACKDQSVSFPLFANTVSGISRAKGGGT